MKIKKSELKQLIRETLREALTEEKVFRSEYKRLMSTPEGRKQYKEMPFEQRQALYKADCEVDPVDQILKKTPDYELEYEGFEEDWYEDHFDPGSYYGHYQTGGVYNVDDFIYKIDAVTLYEFLADFLNGKLKETSPYTLTNEYNKLAQACIDAEGTDEEEVVNEVADVFLAQNLHDFAEIYYEDLLKYYHDDAYEWARDHLDILDTSW